MKEHPHAPNWLKWLGHLRGVLATGIELGTFRGESAEWMMDNIFTHERSRYLCIDTFIGSAEHHVGNIDCSQNEAMTRARLDRFLPRCEVWKYTTEDALAELLFQGDSVLPADFIYVDAAHDAASVLRDAVMSFPLLTIGGVMVFDDYRWTIMPDELDRPAMAIDAFIAIYARKVEVIGTGWQVALRKTAE